MNPKALVPAILVCALFAQVPPKQESKVVLANTPSPQTLMQMADAVKSVGNVEVLHYDEAHTSFTLRGPANLEGLSEWLLHAMDRPAGWRASGEESEAAAAREYHLQPGGYRTDDATPVARVYYLKYATGEADLIETLTTVRVVGEVMQMVKCSAPPMIAFRGSSNTVDLAEWIIRKLDQPAGGEAFRQQKLNPDAWIFRNQTTQPNAAEDMVQVFYLDPATNSQTLRALTQKVRAATKTLRVFDKQSPPSIVIRGDSGLLAQASRIIESR